MVHVRIETDPRIKVQHLKEYLEAHRSRNRDELINIAINHTEENINERISALYALRDILGKTPERFQSKVLTNIEIQKLYHLVKDEEFPVVVYPDEFTVKEITHEIGHENHQYKETITKAIEENDAVLRAEAALLIIDFGQETKKYKEIKHKLVSTITAILGNMVGEPNNLFVKEGKERNEPIVSRYFKGFVEALYFIDKKAAEPFIKIFNITTDDFNLDRRSKENTSYRY